MNKNWLNIYRTAQYKTAKHLKQLSGITVAFNTNIDAIVNFTPSMIRQLMVEIGIGPQALQKRIQEWKGIIEAPADFLAGLCGCFREGKASEWLIQNKESYEFLKENLPLTQQLRMGGQAGIMANVLGLLDIPLVITHCASLPKEQAELFVSKENIVIPVLTAQGKLTYIHPQDHFNPNDPVFMHIISEFRKDNQLAIADQELWVCPRSNRFIATYDPINNYLKISQAFVEGIEQIAKKSDGFLISGFHLLPLEQLELAGIRQKIQTVAQLIHRAKEAHPQLLTHYELCSTKQTVLLKELFDFTKECRLWDSFGANERELIASLRVLGEVQLAKELSINITQEKILDGALLLMKALALRRFHLHEFGCYICLHRKTPFIDPQKIRTALCFSSIIAAERAKTGTVSKNYSIESLFGNFSGEENSFPKTFVELANVVEAKGFCSRDKFLSSGIFEHNDYFIIAIPTILIDNPRFTVGLGDTISSTAFVAELALTKNNPKKNFNSKIKKEEGRKN